MTHADDDDDFTEAEEEAWCDEQREVLAAYFVRKGLRTGEIGEWPAWHVAPIIAVWSIESLKAPGAVGWWAVTGDIPTDYCSSDGGCDNPRRALRRISESWLAAIADTRPGAATLGETGLPAEFADLLRVRAEQLLEWVSEDDGWPPDAPDRARLN